MTVKIWLYQRLREGAKDLEKDHPTLAQEAGYSLSINDIDTAETALQALQATPPSDLLQG